MDKNQDQSIMDKSMRSVFGNIWFELTLKKIASQTQSFLVGNIPYEATEEKLKDIFSEVGPVISLK